MLKCSTGPIRRMQLEKKNCAEQRQPPITLGILSLTLLWCCSIALNLFCVELKNSTSLASLSAHGLCGISHVLFEPSTLPSTNFQRYSSYWKVSKSILMHWLRTEIVCTMPIPCALYMYSFIITCDIILSNATVLAEACNSAVGRFQILATEVDEALFQASFRTSNCLGVCFMPPYLQLGLKCIFTDAGKPHLSIRLDTWSW